MNDVVGSLRFRFYVDVSRYMVKDAMLDLDIMGLGGFGFSI